MHRALESRGFISAILAMAAGSFLFYRHPFPDEQIFLHVIAMRAPQAFLSFKYLYYALLFTTPYLVCSTALSGLYIFTLKARRTISPGRLPQYPDPRREMTSFLSSAKSTTRASRCPPRLPIGSPFPSAVYSRESPSWGLLVVARRVAACFRLPNKFSPTKPPIKRSALVG